MKRIAVRLLVLFSCAALASFTSAPAYAVDGVVLINQNTIINGLPGCPGPNPGNFPIVICQSGSYRLSGDLVVSGATDGIDIDADNVTLDLNGFTVSGPVTCAGSGASISCSGSAGVGILDLSKPNVVIRNGMVRGFSDGVVVQAAAGPRGGELVEEVIAVNNGGYGIAVANALLRRNNASSNGGTGILANHSTVTEDVANGNRLNGLSIFFGLYGSNTFEDNGGAPVNNLSGAVTQGNNSCGTGSPC